MVHIPRFARLFLVAAAVITIPTLYLFYPHEFSLSSSDIDAGGIDQEHYREPVPQHVPPKPHLEDEEVRNVVFDSGDKDATPPPGQQPPTEPVKAHGHKQAAPDKPAGDISNDVLTGQVIMPHLGNETAKAELGRAAWRVLHLMTLRFPDKPTADDRETLKNYFHLFARLYPCGECAAHFQKMLKEYPPQTSSRKSASLWLCSLHNKVNERLGKPEFDCLTLDATYDCGCGDNSTNTTTSASPGATGNTAPLPTTADAAAHQLDPVHED
ncbi:hypothetical protein Q8F55_005111 [Vanrija albida]|uniref:Sulfhydryl oxidase n=1 Tax=Vanrija albida TaxID=181172 RepID=A0ABR3Q0Y2_9TREE